MNQLLAATSIFLCMAGTSTAQIKTNEKFGKGIHIAAEDTSFSLKFATRIQTLYEGHYIVTDDTSITDHYSDKLLTRRARLKFEGFAFSPKVTYKMELGLTNRDHGGGNISQSNNTANIILDAVVKWEVCKNTQLWFGQTKLPGNRERVVSSQSLQFVDRSQVNSNFNIDRDMGIQLHHTSTTGNVVIREIASISMGEGRDITASNSGGYDYTGRVEVLPFGEFTGKGDYFLSDLKREEKPKLALGITYDFDDDATREEGHLGKFLSASTDLSTLLADAIFKYNGICVLGEFANRTSSTSPAITDSTGNILQSFVTGTGVNMQAGYLFKNNVEVAARTTMISPEVATGRNGIQETTLCVSKYIAGHHLKIQSDLSYRKEDHVSDDLLIFRFQVELGL
ncbi:MAG: porin [Flavobacteriales bacterium]|nr:porin [Flavobacteriales bacterium]